MNTFESGVKRRDRKFPISSPASAAFPRRGGEAYRFLRNAARKSCTGLRAGGRVDPSAGPGCPFPAKQAASEPPRFALPLLTTLSAACPLAPTPKGRADRQNRLPLSPILQQMRTFESGVRRDRKFPIQSCLRRVSAQRGRSYRFLRNAARKVALRARDCGHGGRVDPSAGPGCPFPAKQAAPEPPRFALPLLTTLSAPALLRRPKRDAADRQNRLPAFTHPPTDAQRTTVTPSPARVPTDHKRGNAPDPHPHALPGRRNGAIQSERIKPNPPSSYDTPPVQIYEPLLAYMNKQALAHEFPYANLYSQISDALLVNLNARSEAIARIQHETAARIAVVPDSFQARCASARMAC